MKSLALAVVMAGVLAAAGGVAAQQAPSSPPDASQTPAQSSQAPAESKNTNVEINVGSPARPGTEAPSAAPAETRLPDAKNGNKANNQTDSSKDDVSALPRAVASGQSTIFGLSPVTAVVIAAALLVVVILAIVAMTRSNDTYIDTNRGI